MLPLNSSAHKRIVRSFRKEFFVDGEEERMISAFAWSKKKLPAEEKQNPEPDLIWIGLFCFGSLLGGMVGSG